MRAENFEELCKKAWLSRESMDYSTFKKCYTPHMDTLLVKIKEILLEYYQAKELNFFSSLFELVSIYEKAKKALYVDDGELSFSDVTTLVYHILKEIDDSEFLYFRLDSQIEHILLDEFQDTSIIQYEILKPLIEEITSGEGIFENGSFFFVGDVKQSIYRFRGGVSALFSEAQQEHQTELLPLLVNYRSQKQIVEFVNKTFQTRIKNYLPQKTKSQDNGGYVELINTDEVVEETITQVKRLLDLGADVNDIAILCVANKDGEVIKQALIDENIEVVTETKTKLINQKSIKAVLEYLKYIYFGEEIYRYNFFALIEQKPDVIKKPHLKTHKLFEIVKNLIDSYQLFKNDFQLVRFLDVVSNYKDIEALLFEYERLDVEAAASDLKGVRVLTVHKSKGLEYRHVIVIDRMNKPRAGGDAIIYDYDGIELQNIYLRMTNRNFVDEVYAEVLEKEKSLSIEDSLNALYVAFTRARESLFVIFKSKDSIFDILELSVNTYGNLELLTLPKDFTKEPLKQKLEYKALYYGTQSDILALEEEKPEDLQSINFGLAMHYMLEMLAAFDEESIENASHMMRNKYGFILQEEEITDIINRVTRLVNTKEFLELLVGEVYKEKAIRYNNNLRYIDLLVKSQNSWNVIDYKSSLSYSQHHLTQVRYYNKAIEKITGEKVKGYICYLLADEIKLVEV